MLLLSISIFGQATTGETHTVAWQWHSRTLLGVGQTKRKPFLQWLCHVPELLLFGAKQKAVATDMEGVADCGSQHVRRRSEAAFGHPQLQRRSAVCCKPR